jgi:acetoin utilization deacetylase AcuC-like enzyme
MKKVGVVYHDLYARHETGAHPERKDRVLHTIAQLQKYEMFGEHAKAHYIGIQPYAATLDQIRWCHTNSLIERVKSTVAQAEQSGHLLHLDGDTVTSPKTLDAALYAAGGNFAMLDAICNRTVDRGFVLCRPPGHHSNKGEARGFCVFNNIALATEYLFQTKKVSKVAIVDFDAHAGNGTEEIFNTGSPNGDLLMISTHQHPRTLYPGTCFVDDIGEGKQRGKIVNVTFAPGSGHKSVEVAFSRLITPMLEEFKPEFILVSAGYDAHHNDPLTHMGFSSQTFSYMVDEICKIADQYAHGRVACTLEGGYNLEAIGDSITNSVAALAGEKIPCPENAIFEEDADCTEFTENKLLPELKYQLAEYWAFLNDL